MATKTVFTILVWDANKEQFTEQRFILPAFVIDGESFVNGLQAEHVNSALESAREKTKSAQDRASKTAGKDKEQQAKEAKAAVEAEKALAELEKAVTATFGSKQLDAPVDTVIATYAIAFSLEKGKVSVESYKVIHNEVVSYVNQYQGSKTWSDARKNKCAELKGMINAYLAGMFSDMGDGYKPISPEINSQYLEQYFAKVAPVLKRTKVKDAAGDIIGIAEVNGAERACFTYLLLYTYYKNGCDVKAGKPAGKASRWKF